MKKKKILFFGATSFAAKELVDILKNRYEIINLSRSKKEDVNNIYFDLKNIDKHINKINELKYAEYLIYFSSFVPLKEKYADLKDCFDINVYLLIKLLTKIKIKPKKIILASSSSIYGISEKKVNENSILSPENNYSVSKYLQENIFRIYCRENRIKFLSLRLGYVYGRNLNDKRILKVIIKKIKKKKKFKVFNEDKLRFNLIHLKDIAYLINKIFISAEGIFNLVNNEILSLKKVIKIIDANLNTKVKYKNQNLKNFKKSNIISSSKIYKKYKIKAKINFKKGIRDLI